MSKTRYLLKLVAANLLAFSSAFVLGMGMRDINESSISKSSTKPQIHVATSTYLVSRVNPVGVQGLDQYFLNEELKDEPLHLAVRVFDDNLEELIIKDSGTEILDKDLEKFFGVVRLDFNYDREHSSRHSFVITAVDGSGNKTSVKVQTLKNSIVKEETNYRDNEAPYIIFFDWSKVWDEKYKGEGYTASVLYNDMSVGLIGDVYKAPFDVEWIFSSRVCDQDILSYKLYINDTLVDQENFSKEREVDGKKALSPAETHFFLYHPFIPKNFPGKTYKVRLEVKDRSNHSATRTVTVVDAQKPQGFLASQKSAAVDFYDAQNER